MAMLTRFTVSQIIELAEKYKVFPSQILLSWALQRGTSIVPKSNRPERILLNTQVIQLEESDFEKIEFLRDEVTSVRMNDSRNHIGFDIYNEHVEEPID